jgi:hypothetical protein
MDIQAASTKNDRKVAPVYLVFTGEIMLNAPRDVAWPQAINYPSWQNYTIVQNVSGRPGEEGEVVLLKKEELNFPPYYARTIKLEPPSRVIWKVFLDKDAAMDLFGIVEFNLHEVGGKTRFCYNLLYEFMVPYTDESELKAFRDQQHKEFAEALEVMWVKLKNMIG